VAIPSAFSNLLWALGFRLLTSRDRPRATIDDEVRERLRAIAGTRLTAAGVLAIDARRHRTQAENRQDARDRLVALLRKRRRKTRPTAGSVQRRMASKRRRSETKRGRGKVAGEE
jgi:ribosome-associated protein